MAKGLEEGIHSQFKLFLLLITEKQFLSAKKLSETFVLVFYAQYLRFWEQIKRDTLLSIVILGNQSRSMFCFTVINEEDTASHR